MSDASIEARRDLVVDLYLRQGLSERKIAGQLGLSRSTVHRHLKARDIPGRAPSPRAAAIARWSPYAAAIEARRDLVVERYLRLNNTEREIAAALGLTRATVRRDLKARDVPRRPSGTRPGNVPHGTVGAVELARTLGASRSYVYEHADELGVLAVHPRLHFDPQQAIALGRERLSAHTLAKLGRLQDGFARRLWKRGARPAARRLWGRAEKALAARKGTRVGRPPGSGAALTRELRERIDALRDEGLSNRAIADKLPVSEATVRRYRPASETLPPRPGASETLTG